MIDRTHAYHGRWNLMEWGAKNDRPVFVRRWIPKIFSDATIVVDINPADELGVWCRRYYKDDQIVGYRDDVIWTSSHTPSAALFGLE